VRRRIEREPDAVIDYVQICDADSLADVEKINSTSILLLAVKIGTTRLIDNHFLLEKMP
jgi:pantoate--beta-alanine ligase